MKGRGISEDNKFRWKYPRTIGYYFNCLRGYYNEPTLRNVIGNDRRIMARENVNELIKLWNKNETW